MCLGRSTFRIQGKVTRPLISSSIPLNEFFQLSFTLMSWQRYDKMVQNLFSVSLQILCHSSAILHMTPLYFFGSNLIYFQQKQPIKVHIFRLSTACVKIDRIPNVIFQTKGQFFSKFRSVFSVMRDYSSVLFQLKLYMLLTKTVRQSANFETFNCSHEN